MGTCRQRGFAQGKLLAAVARLGDRVRLVPAVTDEQPAGQPDSTVGEPAELTSLFVQTTSPLCLLRRQSCQVFSR